MAIQRWPGPKGQINQAISPPNSPDNHRKAIALAFLNYYYIFYKHIYDKEVPNGLSKTWLKKMAEGYSLYQAKLEKEVGELLKTDTATN